MWTHLILTWDHPADFSDVILDLQQWRAGKNQSLNICFFLSLAKEKGRQEKPTQGEIMMELKVLKYHQDISGLYFGFHTCPRSQLFLLLIETCSVSMQMLGPCFYTEQL